MLELEHGAIVDRNACVFCHLGLYRNGTFIVEQVWALLSLVRQFRLRKPAALLGAASTPSSAQPAPRLCARAEPRHCCEACLSIHSLAWHFTEPHAVSVCRLLL